MAKDQKQYAPEFKQQIVDLYNTGNYTIYPYDYIKKGLGYHQLEIYVPIKLKGEK